MAVTIKNAEQLDKMRVAGKLAAQVLGMIEPYVVPGVTTDELDRRCHQYITEVQGAIPAPLNYKGFPRSVCTSVNNVVCHGIPGPKVLKKGDILNIDVTVIKDGFHGDTSRMFHIGEVGVLAKRLCVVARDALCVGIDLARPGTKLGEIGRAVQKHVEAQGFSVVRDYCGHGIGEVFHEDPQVLHYYDPSRGMGLELAPGMTFTIEPMVNAGGYLVRLLPDGWTVVTKDRSLSAQWEHTLAITDTGVEVLTRRPEENW